MANSLYVGGVMMIGEKEELEYFINECRSYRYYVKKVTECNDKLIEINNKLEGLSSPGVKEIIYENASDPYKEKKLYWLCEEEKVVAEKIKWQSHIDNVNSVLDLIPEEVDKKIVIDVFIKRKNTDHLADKYNYAERSSLLRHAKSQLKKVLKMSHVAHKTR